MGNHKINIRARGKCKCGREFLPIGNPDPEIKKGWRRDSWLYCVFCKAFPKTYYLDFFYSGKRFKVYSDHGGMTIDSWERAEYLAFQIRTEIEDSSFDPTKYLKAEAGGYWTKNLLDKFFKAKEKEIAPSYLPDYRRMVNRAKEFFSTKDVREMRTVDLNNYRDYLAEKLSLSAKSISNYLGHFKYFLRWCMADEQILSVIPAFPKVKFNRPRIKWLSAEDQQRLFQYVPEQDKPIIAFLMLHGCRPGEARALRVGDVDLRTQTITIGATFSRYIYREKRKGQESKAFTIPIHSESLPFIQERVKSSLPGAWLFVNARTQNHYSENKLADVWNAVREKAGITGIRLYDATRHSLGSQLANEGNSIFLISKILGHAHVKTTEENYLHSDIEAMRVTLDKLSLNKVVNFPSGHEVAMNEKTG